MVIILPLAGYITDILCLDIWYFAHRYKCRNGELVRANSCNSFAVIGVLYFWVNVGRLVSHGCTYGCCR